MTIRKMTGLTTAAQKGLADFLVGLTQFLFQRVMRILCSRKRLFILLIVLLIASVSQASVDATKIAYQTMRGETFTYDLKVIDADGKKPIKLTKGQASDASPAWSPDGGQIAFASNRDGDYDLYIMNTKTDNTIQLTNNLHTIDLEPSWSSDGRQIAFASKKDGIYDVYVMNADGSNLVNLTQNPRTDRSPSWSPDGRQITFASTRNRGIFDVFVINADGSNLINLTRNPARDDWYPSWSPDGRQITFASARDEDFEIYVMDPDGGNIIQLTKNQEDDDYPCWSPDGSQIAFTTDRDGNYEIYIMNADGSNPVNLTQTWFEHDMLPAWQPIPLSVSTEGKLVTLWGTIKQLK